MVFKGVYLKTERVFFNWHLFGVFASFSVHFLMAKEFNRKPDRQCLEAGWGAFANRKGHFKHIDTFHKIKNLRITKEHAKVK